MLCDRDRRDAEENIAVAGRRAKASVGTTAEEGAAAAVVPAVTVPVPVAVVPAAAVPAAAPAAAAVVPGVTVPAAAAVALIGYELVKITASSVPETCARCRSASGGRTSSGT